jgi:hypothetical protein
MKKGISPLIGWVLIIGFSVSAGLLITTWAIDQFKDLELPNNWEAYCDQVDLRLSDAGTGLEILNNQEIRLNLTNEGAFSIKRLSLGRTTTKFTLAWCEQLLGGSEITPNSEQFVTFIVTANNTIEYSNVDNVDCSGLNARPQEDLDPLTLPWATHNLTHVQITPWITIDDKTFACAEKGIILNNESLLNRYYT